VQPRDPPRAPSRRRPPLPRSRPAARRAVACVLAATALLAGAACRPAAPAFGATREAALANSDAFFGGIAARFTNVQRTPKFAAARSRLSRHALSPSGIFDDTSVWTAAAGDTRLLTLSGRGAGNRYVFDASATAPAPVRPGDSRHLMRLRRLGEGQYEWFTTVDMAAGGATPDELLAVWRALLASAARGSEPLLRAEYRAAVPRATAVLGELATLDTLQVSPVGDGSAVVTLSVSLHPERLRAHYPHFAQYVVKYVQPARYAFTFSDERGARWIIATARRNRLVFQLRAMPDGRLGPLDGTPRPLPDTLVMSGEAFAKFSIFTVGVTRLEARMAVLGTPQERGWDFRFRKEPKWHFPLAVNNLIRSALRRPFADQGMQLRLSAQRRPDGQTLIARRVTVNVQEGAIVRWLGGLGAGAMDEFSGRAEQDENRFTAALFSALQDDFAALLQTTP
jgi:hypothetical protein